MGINGEELIGERNQNVQLPPPAEVQNAKADEDTPITPMPFGLIISFLSGLLILVLTAIIRLFKPSIEQVVTQGQGLDSWLISL